jgi:antirestriction protein ArdC
MENLLEQVIADMENGVMPWERDWFYLESVNYSTDKKYKGWNKLELAHSQSRNGFEYGQWLTFLQCKSLKGSVKEGSRGTHLKFYSYLPITKNGEKVLDEKGQVKFKSVLNSFTVFNIAQTTLTPKPTDVQKTEKERNAIGDGYLSRAEVVYSEYTATPCYNRKTDKITMPTINNFKTEEGFYSTAFHELTHWTAPRVGRNVDNYSKNIKARAFEELIAELGGAILSTDIGYKYNTNHSSYIKGWLEELKNDKTMLSKAFSKAEKAVDFIKA